MPVSRFGVPDLGIGVGFRVPHYRQVVEEHPEMDWFEIISENFMVDGGSPRYHLDRLREAYPVVPHGVSLSLGSAGDADHLQRLTALVHTVDPPWLSDHLCWTGTPDLRAHDLLPLPYTEEVLHHLVRRIREVQDRMERPFAVENVSSYVSWKDSVFTEWSFLSAVVEEADCALLLDVNNVYVSACNHGFDARAYIDALPLDRVVQVHLAGHSVLPTHRLDTHDHPVCEEVWALYEYLVERLGSVSTLIEWDAHIPSFERLQEEAAQARLRRDRALARRAS